MSVENQLVSIRKTQSKIVDILSLEILEKIRKMNLNGSIPMSAFLRKYNFNKDSEENKVLNSVYNKAVFKATAKKLFWKGYRVKVTYFKHMLSYEATLIDLKSIKLLANLLGFLLIICVGLVIHNWDLF